MAQHLTSLSILSSIPQFKLAVRGTRSAPPTGPALRTSALTHAMCQIILAVTGPFASPCNTALSATVPQSGPEIHISNVTNVGSFPLAKSSPDAHRHNVADECKVNADCPQTKACVSQECVDPCLTTSCGTNAQCQVDFHTAKCVCRPGLQGNPYVKCLEVECRLDTDCGDRERCDRSIQECVPLCVDDPCALGATCEARNHKEYCTCNPPLQGDGYVSCTERKRELQVPIRYCGAFLGVCHMKGSFSISC